MPKPFNIFTKIVDFLTECGPQHESSITEMMRQPAGDIKLALMKLAMQGILRQADKGDDPLWSVAAINGMQKMTLTPVEIPVEEIGMQEPDVPVKKQKTEPEGKIAKDHAALFAQKAEAHFAWMAMQKARALKGVQSKKQVSTKLSNQRQDKSREKTSGPGKKM